MNKNLIFVSALILAGCGGGGGEYCATITGKQVSCDYNPHPSSNTAPASTASSVPPSVATPAPKAAPAPATGTPAPAPVASTVSIDHAQVGPDGYAWGFAIKDFQAPEPNAQVCRSLNLVVYGNTLAKVELQNVNDVRRTYGDFGIIFHNTEANYHMEIAAPGWITARVVAYDPYGKEKEVMAPRSWYLNPSC